MEKGLKQALEVKNMITGKTFEEAKELPFDNIFHIEPEYFDFNYSNIAGTIINNNGMAELCSSIDYYPDLAPEIVEIELEIE